MFDFIKNKTIFANKYHTHSDAVIISCFFNPQKSTYRLTAFRKFYDSIKHLNHRIIECVIGDSTPQLDAFDDKHIQTVYTPNLLWHKEGLLNKIVSELPNKYKYVFWVDADVIFTNNNWLVESVNDLKTNKIIQPFEYCFHLDKYQPVPGGHIEYNIDEPNVLNKKAWRSFCSNYVKNSLWKSLNYNTHGHVGFAWGARREVLDNCPLYDKALIGGADHIIAHAAAGQIDHNCITQSFTEDIDEIRNWSNKFYNQVLGKIGYVKGNLYHIWHGDIEKREYLKRIQGFGPISKGIKEKDSNGLFITKKGDDQYVKDYYKNREATDDGFFDSMVIANLTNSTLMGTLLGGNPAGALIGDMMNNSEEIQNNSTTFDDGTQLPSVGAELGGAVGEQISHESNIGDNPFS
jgi:hypothetical protein